MAKDKKEKSKKRQNTVKIYALYDKGTRKNQTCPKCGPGVFLANHKDRLSCGKCGYMETKGDKKPAKVDAPVPEKKKEPNRKRDVQMDEVEEVAIDKVKIDVDKNQMKDEKDLASVELEE